MGQDLVQGILRNVEKVLNNVSEEFSKKGQGSENVITCATHTNTHKNRLNESKLSEGNSDSSDSDISAAVERITYRLHEDKT
jgi:hypothetical protein